MKTYMANPDKIERKWYVVDAEGCTLGRLSSEIAKVLRGKNKPEYTPHVDTGDYVIVVNADKVKVTGKKLQQKIYYNHSDYVGGMRETTLAEMLAKKPEKVVELAVKGMLPKGPLGRAMIKKLHVYAGAEHNNQAQKPEVLTFKGKVERRTLHWLTQNITEQEEEKNLLQEYILYREQERSQSIKEISMSILDWKH